VVGGDVNQNLVEALKKEYGLDAAKTNFKNLTLAEIPQAIKTKQVSALLGVMPLTEKYLTMLRGFFPKTGPKLQPALVPIESAGAIAAVTRYYQSYDLPKGAVQGSPPIPDDDMKTLHVPFYLVANKKLSDDVVGSLAKAIMSARRRRSANPTPIRRMRKTTLTSRFIQVPRPTLVAMRKRSLTSMAINYSTAPCCLAH
jgi:TRAP-type uncharacterized transport system substrate-binding protein